MAENLADFFISSAYKQPVSDNVWEVIEEKWDGTFLEVFIKTKQPVYNPLCKYQFEPSIIECSFNLEKRFGWWQGSIKSASVQNSFVDKYVRRKNMKLLLQRILSIFSKKGVTARQKWLPSCQTNSFKAIDSGTVSGKTYSSRLLGDTDFCKTDLIVNDPFFSQVEKTINNVGLEQASEILGAEVISIYTKLMRKRLERQI